MKTLLDDRFAPITSCVGFLETPLARFGDALRTWRDSLGARVATSSVREPFPQVLRRLEPLTLAVRPRELLLATQSPWTAYFDCLAQGPDPVGVVGHLSQMLGCRGLVVTCVPNTHRRGAGGRYGSIQFELLGPEPTDWLNYVRTITAANDGGRWVFHTHGAVRPFEQPERYAAKKVAGRFTADMLDEYCAALGVHYFDSNYYGPDGLLFEVAIPLRPGVTVVSMALEEAQRRLGIPAREK